MLRDTREIILLLVLTKLGPYKVTKWKVWKWRNLHQKDENPVQFVKNNEISIRKNLFVDWIFLKFISWFRGIVLKRFQTDSSSLKVRTQVLMCFFALEKTAKNQDFHGFESVLQSYGHQNSIMFQKVAP